MRVRAVDKEDAPTVRGRIHASQKCLIVLDQGALALVLVQILLLSHTAVISKDNRGICIQVVLVTVGNTTDTPRAVLD